MKAEQIIQIENYLISQGFSNRELIDDLKDHLAIEIEGLMATGTRFEDSFELAKIKLLPYSPYQLEKDLKLLTTQKHNIMFKKIGFIGGYLSALGLCIALLLAVLAFQNEFKVDSRKESLSLEDQYVMSRTNQNVNSETRLEMYREYYEETAQLKMKAIDQLSGSQSILIVSIILFGMTYLPYRFYNGYQKSELELT